MQSEVFRFEKSFEHSPKPSKRQFYAVSNDYDAQHRHLEQTNIEH